MMAVSKRTRFEVFRRDNHTCRYCGQAAPDVKVTIDHVTPKTLGGSDNPDNLVTACYDCNFGKSSVPPDAPLVDAVREETLRYMDRIRRAWHMRTTEIKERNAYIDHIGTHFTFLKPDDWRKFIGVCYDSQVPEAVLLDAIKIADAKYDPWGRIDRFAYFAGVVRNQMQTIGAGVVASFDLDGYWWTDEDLEAERRDARNAALTIEHMVAHVAEGSYRDAVEGHRTSDWLTGQPCG